jgi:AbiTii
MSCLTRDWVRSEVSERRRFLPQNVSNKDLLLEIQKEAVDGNTELSTVLRKCLVLATRLGHRQLKDWANWELNGYPASSELPDYRILKGLHSFGHFFGIAGSAIKNAPLSLLNLPEPGRRNFQDPPLREGVASIAEMARIHSDGTVHWAWPPEACAVFSHRDYRDDLRLVQAWISVPITRLTGLLDTIRNRVLNFALEIESVLPESDDNTHSGSNAAKSALVTQVLHQTIYGPVSNVGTAGSFSQTMIDNRGNFTALKDQLRETGIPESEIQELEKAIKADEGESKPAGHHFGKSVAKWMGDTVKKAANGAIKIGVDVVATVATKALKDYYGIGGGT